MTPPLLLLGLYLGLFILSLILCGWAGHLRPAPEAAQRVTDAVERAALAHLKSPAKISGVAIALLGIAFALSAQIKGEQTVGWYLGGCALGPVVLASCLFYASRKALRASGQLVGARAADTQSRISSRNAVSVVLFVEATVGLLFLGLQTLVAAVHGPLVAGQVVLATATSFSVAALIFARAATTAILTTSEIADPKEEAPHPASLAVLIGASYHAPLLRLLGLVALSTVGQAALLASVSSSPDAASLVYPHVLKLLGLFGLLFAGAVVRMTDEEDPSAGWTRGGLVYLVLMIAGAWSLSSPLPELWAHVVPSGLTFFYVALGVTVWSFGRRTSDDPYRASFLKNSATRAPQGVLLLSLVVVLLLTSATLSEENALPAPVLLSLLLAGALSAAPFSVVWLLARDLGEGSVRTEQLAYPEQMNTSAPRSEPSGKMLRVFPLLCSVVLVTSLSGLLMTRTELDELSLSILFLATLVAALGLLAVLGYLETGTRGPARKIALLLGADSATEQDAVNFEKAVLYAGQGIAHRELAFLAFTLVPSVCFLGALPFIPTLFGRALLLGLGIGFAGVGVCLETVSASDRNSGQRSLGALALIISLAQATWLLTLGGLSAPLL